MIKCFLRFSVLVLVIAPVMAQAAPKESLFFTYDQLIAISQANQGFTAKEATEEAKTDDTAAQVDRGRRILTLSGIVYNSPKDWTIWLNDERVTPLNIPDHIRGLTVKKDLILLKWEDTATNRIVDLTLRPHQRYSLDLDVILSGT